MALAAVPSTEARPTFLRGFFTRPAVIDGHLHADEGEERHARGDADAAVEAPARGVERTEVGGADEEPADDADERAAAGTSGRP